MIKPGGRGRSIMSATYTKGWNGCRGPVGSQDGRCVWLGVVFGGLFFTECWRGCRVSSLAYGHTTLRIRLPSVRQVQAVRTQLTWIRRRPGNRGSATFLPFCKPSPRLQNTFAVTPPLLSFTGLYQVLSPFCKRASR